MELYKLKETINRLQRIAYELDLTKEISQDKINAIFNTLNILKKYYQEKADMELKNDK